MKIDLFGIQFDNLGMGEVLGKIQEFLQDGKQHYIVLPYSEFVVRAQKDRGFKNILNQADLCLCESRGLYLVARLVGRELKQNIYGVNLINKLDSKLFLFGSEDGAVLKAAEKLGDNVIGFENRHQNFNKAIERVNLIKPEILLVGLGSPKQEQFIAENLSKMPSVKLAIGVGGAFDFISGRVKRAPKIFQKIGLEWLWRLVLQPTRIKRVFIGVGGLLVLTIKNMLQFKKENKKGRLN
jgi:N-acetylglucosaminyldiphosphoundecaprenol N-acetyl-beta-D-mannosaminyltransferase